MNSAEIKQKRDDIEQRLREHDAARIPIEAELKALQHVCRHPNASEWTSGDYGGGTDHHYNCPDCGYARTT